ncbi:unnamed protein product [Callosobruchus maculatus]|uniref:PiggyBac transposable element-derived protein domain-containing protein n=1 Tax=Callosobruchus maculatus TaxID=64391 RepID=A0A653DFM5_CALMS|nr:unnamed protein product [Callosobruchus maculatus]
MQEFLKGRATILGALESTVNNDKVVKCRQATSTSKGLVSGTVGSTSHGVSPIGHVKRYNKSEKKYVQVPRPNLIGEYNRYMSGMDLMDENISTYRIGVRSKKWWWCIFTWLIDASINNARILWKRVQKNQISQLDFRRSIAQTYLKRYENVQRGGGRPSTSKFSLSLNRISDDPRYDGLNHLLVSIPDKKRRSCAGEAQQTCLAVDESIDTQAEQQIVEILSKSRSMENFVSKKGKIKVEVLQLINSLTSLTFYVLPTITGGVPMIKVSRNELKVPTHIPLADPTFDSLGEIDMLIGRNDLLILEMVKGGEKKSKITKEEDEKAKGIKGGKPSEKKEKGKKEIDEEYRGG